MIIAGVDVLKQCRLIRVVVSTSEKQFDDFLLIDTAKFDSILADFAQLQFKLKWATIKKNYNTESMHESISDCAVKKGSEGLTVPYNI